MSLTQTPSTASRFHGCLLGGAVGDALGAPVEFLRLPEIFQQFGAGGIRDFAQAYGRLGAITDDTQMTLFTAEGLMRAGVRYATKGICHPPSIVHHAYLRWLATQGQRPAKLALDVEMDGWLAAVPQLRSVRAPGYTCVSALRETTALGNPARNGSKGCGAVMRIAPVGLVAGHTPQQIFQLGADIASLTHGHPSGSLGAGFLALTIAELVAGAALHDAVETSVRCLRAYNNHEELLSAVEKAQSLAYLGAPHATQVESIGAGWVAEEAVAIALYSVLATSTFEDAIILAVNHSGDSDSTGAVAGSIAGTLYGVSEIPTRWLDELELREEITAIADDLLGMSSGALDLEDRTTRARYPGW